MIIKPPRRLLLTPEGRVLDKSAEGKLRTYESASSLSKARECMIVYRDHYEHRQAEYSSPSLVFGRAWHRTAEDVMAEKYFAGTLLKKQRVYQLFQWRWDEEYKSAREEGLIWGGKFSPEFMLQKGFALLALWLEDFATNLTPLDIPEAPFWITLTGCKRALYGLMDLTVKDEGGGLIDYKTTMSRWLVDDSLPVVPEHTLFQVALYHMGYYSLYRSWPMWAELHRPVIVGTPTIERIPVLMTDEHVQDVIDNEVKPLVRAIETAWATDAWTCTCGKHVGSPA